MSNWEKEKINWNMGKQDNYVELAERQVFQKIEEDLNIIQQNLFEKSEKNITIKQAKDELKKINEWLQNSRNVWKVNKEKFSNAIGNISEKNIDRAELKTAIEEIIKDAKEIINSSKNEQTKLKRSIIWERYQIPEFNPDAKEWRIQSIKDFEESVENMQEDRNSFAAGIGRLIKKLMS